MISHSPHLAYTLVVVAHIAAGFVALTAGWLPFWTRKGADDHRRWGWLFVWAMSLSALSALPLAFWRHDVFQAALGLWSGYAVWFSVRVLRRHRFSRNSLWLEAGVGALALALFVWLTIWGGQILSEQPATGRAALVFAVLGLMLVARDAQSLWSRDFSARRRVIDHLLASSLALTSAYSAFLNTQFTRLTGIPWLIDLKMGLPFALALPVLAFYAWKWHSRLSRAALQKS